MSNYKGLLQEYYQKIGASKLPQYSLYSHSESNGLHNYVSQVVLPDGQVILGDGSKNKKLSEQSASLKVIQQLKIIDVPDEVKSTKTNGRSVKYFILIDIENKPLSLQINFPPDSYVIGFISKYSHHYQNRDQLKTKCQLEIIDSGNKDSADCLFVFHTSSLLNDILHLLNGHSPLPHFRTIMDDIEVSPDFKLILVSSDKFIDTVSHIVCSKVGNDRCQVMTDHTELIRYDW